VTDEGLKSSPHFKSDNQIRAKYVLLGDLGMAMRLSKFFTLSVSLIMAGRWFTILSSQNVPYGPALACLIRKSR